MVLPVVRNAALAVLVGWLLYAGQGQLLAGREAEVGAQGELRVKAFFPPQDIQNRPDRGARGPGQDAGAAGAAPGAAPALHPAPHRSLTIPAGRNGHFALDARVNGKTVRFMIDTGASAVVLNREDAARIGLRPRELDFTGTASTANGTVRWAPVVLRDFRVGGLTLREMEATVNGGPLGVSLLGMDFLRRLKSYEVRNGRLVLYW